MGMRDWEKNPWTPEDSQRAAELAASPFYQQFNAERDAEERAADLEAEKRRAFFIWTDRIERGLP